MPYQTGRNILVASLVESAFGVLPGTSGAEVFRPNTGKLSLTRDPIRSGENRRDGMTTRGRLGSHNVPGTYTCDLSLASYDTWIEAVFRGTFTSELVITEATASLTSITTTTSTIVAAAGSWITAGLRVGDVIRLTGHATSANNSRNLRITGLTASTITVAETLVLNAVADTAFTITRPKKLVQGLVPRSFTIEEYEGDIDGSEVFLGCRITQMQIRLAPNGMVTLTFTIVGQTMQVMEDGDAPYFVTPTATTSIGMTAVEAKIRLGTTDVLDVSSLDITINLNGAGNPVVGSVLTPDVFTNNATVEGSIVSLRSDLDRVKQFLAETELSLSLLCTENEAEPQDFCSFYIGNMTIGSAEKSDLGADGARTQTKSMMIGIDERGGAYEPSMIVYQTSAAA